MANTGTPVVLLLLEGRPRLLYDAPDKVSAVVHAFLPGPDGGKCLADILFGKISPSGKMPITYPRDPANALVPYWHKNSDSVSFSPRWEFGHGLSYTEFRYSNLRVAPTNPTYKQDITVEFTVSNVGKVASKEAVLLFISQKYRRVTPEVRMLKRFDKVFLHPGESVDVSFILHPEKDLSYIGLSNELVIETGEFVAMVENQKVEFELVESGKDRGHIIPLFGVVPKVSNHIVKDNSALGSSNGGSNVAEFIIALVAGLLIGAVTTIVVMKSFAPTQAIPLAKQELDITKDLPWEDHRSNEIYGSL